MTNNSERGSPEAGKRSALDAAGSQVCAIVAHCPLGSRKGEWKVITLPLFVGVTCFLCTEFFTLGFDSDSVTLCSSCHPSTALEPEQSP